MNQHEFVQSLWSHCKRNRYESPGDFWALSNLYPTPDRRQLRRGPGWSSFTTWSQGFRYPSGAFYNAALLDKPYYCFVGQDADTSELALIVYYGNGWNSDVVYSAIYDLDVADSRLRGLHGRNHVLWYGQDLFAVCGSQEDVYKFADFGSGVEVYDGNVEDDARLLAIHGDAIYLVTETGQVWYTNDTAAGFTQMFDPAPFLNIRFCVPTAHYLLLFAYTEAGSIQLYRLPLTTDMANKPVALQPIDTVLNVPGYLPIADTTRYHELPFAVDGGTVYFLSGHLPEFNNPAMDVYRFNGSQVQRIARLEPGELLNPTSSVYAMGLAIWQGELVLYQVGPAGTWAKVLAGDRFTDLADLTTTVPWATQTSGYSGFYNLAGRLFFTGQNGSDYGFIVSKGYADGYVETSWLDMDRPGLLKHLNRLTAHVQTPAAGVTVTVSYKRDDEAAYTTATATANAGRVHLDNIGADFYRLRVKIALADTGATPTDTRIDSLSVHYTV